LWEEYLAYILNKNTHDGICIATAEVVIENNVCGKQHGSEMVSGLVSNVSNVTGGG